MGQVTVEDLEAAVKCRIDIINCQHPPHNSRRFMENAFKKWACKEILREIQISGDLPFLESAEDILYRLKKKMDSAPGHIMCFSVGADVVDEFIEKCEDRR